MLLSWILLVGLEKMELVRIIASESIRPHGIVLLIRFCFCHFCVFVLSFLDMIVYHIYVFSQL